MRVLVAGATGFVAGALVPRLLGAGHQVVAAGHDAARLERFPEAERLVLDLRRPDLAEQLPPDLDAIVHLAQANAPFPQGAGELFEVNVVSVQRLLEHARQRGLRRFVYASSASVYGGGERPWRESDPTEGPGYYAATKQAVERLAGAYAELFPVVILRLVAPYGPGQRNRLVPGLISRIQEGRPVSLREGGRPRMNPIFVEDVAEVFAQALQDPAPPASAAVNVGGDEVLSIREMGVAIGRVCGREPVFEEAPGESGGDVVVDTTRMRQVFRLPERLTSFGAGVRATLGR
jgi:nucleoside-diphosphate-sugar epimerase